MTKAAKTEPKSQPHPTQEVPPWWNASFCSDMERFGPTARMMVHHAITTGAQVWAGTCKGVLEDQGEDNAKEAFLGALCEVVGAKAIFATGPVFGRGTHETWLAWDKGAITVTFGIDDKVHISFTTTDEDHYGSLGERIGEYLLPENVRQPVYALAETGGGIEIQEVGLAGQPYEPDNYEEDVSDGFSFIVDDLQRDEPVGRLTIIEGDPGTGKTFFIRGIINEVLDAIFVLVPSHMVDDLAGPELVPMLIKAHGLAGSTKPIVLVIEDADRALVPREEGSLAAISALLNVSDGILGRVLNLRILCTTNQPIEEIDEALKRPGRLSKHLHIGPLSKERAEAVYARITEGEEVEFEGEVTLSQVYQFARTEEIAEEEGDEDEEDDDDDDEDEDDEDDE